MNKEDYRGILEKIDRLTAERDEIYTRKEKYWFRAWCENRTEFLHTVRAFLDNAEMPKTEDAEENELFAQCVFKSYEAAKYYTPEHGKGYL